jgi:K(+)-stimulated pyrophosphate-energized sodium pump
LLLYWILDWKAAITAVFGVLTSLLASYIGMSVSVRTNLQTADIAREGKKEPFRTALFGGSVMGLCITGLSLIVLSVLFSIFRDPDALIGFAFGGGLAALFAQIGGGIFTKSADMARTWWARLKKIIPRTTPATRRSLRTWLAITWAIALAAARTCSKPSATTW